MKKSNLVQYLIPVILYLFGSEQLLAETPSNEFRCTGSVFSMTSLRDNSSEIPLRDSIKNAPVTSGADTLHENKSTANGSTSTFEYSNDGTNFKPVNTLANTSYTATVMTPSMGDNISDSSFDDITFVINDDPAENVITLDNVNPYQIFQRNASNQANVVVSGTYVGSPSAIEASFNGGAFITIDTSPRGGTYSGNLLAQNVGQGDLVVRFSNDVGIYDTVNYVGVGDIFIVSGQSNASGRGNTLNTYTHATLKASLFGNDDNWKELSDASDNNISQVDRVSSDFIAEGSPWPIIATNIMANYGIPVAFVPTAKGGTLISQWQPAANHSDASTLYGSMNRRITAVGGVVKGVLFFQGETDSSFGVAQATYETRLENFVNTVEFDFSGTRTLIGQIGQSISTGNDAIRAAQIATINSNSNALLGPATYDINLSDQDGDTLHFKSDSDMATFAARWYAAINKEFYDAVDGYGPILNASNLEYRPIDNKIIVPFTDDSLPVISATSTVTKEAFVLRNNGVIIALASISIGDDSLELTPVSTLNLSQSIMLTYASSNDAVDNAIYDSNNLPAQPFYNEAVGVNSSDLVLLQIGKEADEPDNVISDVTVLEINTIVPAITNAIIENELAYQNYIDTNPTNFGVVATAIEVQSMVNAVNIALASKVALTEILEDSASVAGNNNTNGTPVTAIELAAITGIMNVNPTNEAAYQSAITLETGFSNLPTVSEVQAIINEVNNVWVIINSSNANPVTLTEAKLTVAGVTNTGFTPSEIARIAQEIITIIPMPTTTKEIQAIVNEVLTQPALGITDFSIQEFSVYPIPSSDIINISIEVESVIIYNINNVKVLESNFKSFSIQTLASGVYFALIKTKQGTLTKRIVRK